MSRAKGRGFVLMSSILKRKLQTRKTNPQFEIIFGALFLLLICIIMLNSKFFLVDNVEIKGNQRVSSEDIILNARLSSYPNIFRVDSKKIKTAILQDFRIAAVKIKHQLPDKVMIEIQERIPICLLSYLNNLLIIGDDGVVMSIQEETEPVEIPIVSGAMLKDVKYGEKVVSSDFQTALKVLRYSDDYLRQVISEIDLSNFRLYLDLPKYRHPVAVELGNAEQLERKIANLRAILLSSDLNDKLERIDLRVADLPTVITSNSLKKL